MIFYTLNDYPANKISLVIISPHWLADVSMRSDTKPNVMPDQREGTVRTEGFVAARIETSAS